MVYILVTNHSVQELVDEVNEYIAKGFIPQGGASSVPVNGGLHHIMVQAMVKQGNG